MRPALLLTALLAASPAFAQPAFAQDDDAAFGARVRAYLVENPEVLLEAMEALETRRQAAEAAEDGVLIAANADALFRDGFSHAFGPEDADVTIVEFADYRCGYCKAAHPAVTELLASDPGLRVIYKEFPILGPDSVLASRVAMATLTVDAAAYERLHDAMLGHKGQLDEAAIWDHVENSGADVAAVRAAMEAPEIAERIRATYALAQAMRVEGTPSFVIGDTVVRGFVQVEQMRALVEQARKKG